MLSYMQYAQQRYDRIGQDRDRLSQIDIDLHVNMIVVSKNIVMINDTGIRAKVKSFT